MQWEANLIELLQRGSNAFLDYFMKGLTYLGDEIFFIIVVAVFFWCINKRFAFKMANVYFLSVGVVEGLKNIIRRPRPFNAYPDKVKSILGDTHGYSMPSGHTHSITNLSTQLSMNYYKTKAFKPILFSGIAAVVIVLITRLYLGQHYLTDVLMGLVLGVLCAGTFSLLFEFLKDKEEMLFVVIAPLCIIAAIIVSVAMPIDKSKDILSVLGAYPAFTIGYFVEKRYVKYDVKSDKKYKYVLKVLLGLALVLALKELPKFFLPDNIPFLYGFLRYFIVALFASLGAPFLFKKLKL